MDRLFSVLVFQQLAAKGANPSFRYVRQTKGPTKKAVQALSLVGRTLLQGCSWLWSTRPKLRQVPKTPTS